MPGETSLPLLSICRRNMHQFLDHRSLGSVSLLEIKKFLRYKSIDFSDSHACLSIQVPVHLLTGESPPSRWRNVEGGVTTIYINKTTGSFVCPFLALSDDWKKLQSFLTSWHKNRSLRKGQEAAAEKYPELRSLPVQTSKEVGEFWAKCLPIESLTLAEFKEVLKAFKLPVRDLKVDDFVRLEVRVSPEHDELVFPARYSQDKSPIISLRRIRLSHLDGGAIVEENFPGLSPTSDGSRIFPFPHGLDMATRLDSSAPVLLVTSVLDSVVIRSRTSFVPVALADGASNLHPDHLPFFEQFDKLGIWFPNDTPSFESARSFAKKLGEKRCQMIGRDFPSPVACLKLKKSVDHVIKANLKPCSHEFITTFESLRQDVFLEMAHFEQIEGK